LLKSRKFLLLVISGVVLRSLFSIVRARQIRASIAFFHTHLGQLASAAGFGSWGDGFESSGRLKSRVEASTRLVQFLDFGNRLGARFACPGASFGRWRIRFHSQDKPLSSGLPGTMTFSVSEPVMSF